MARGVTGTVTVAAPVHITGTLNTSLLPPASVGYIHIHIIQVPT
jgi:hypothetical protein